MRREKNLCEGGPWQAAPPSTKAPAHEVPRARGAEGGEEAGRCAVAVRRPSYPERLRIGRRRAFPAAVRASRVEAFGLFILRAKKVRLIGIQ